MGQEIFYCSGCLSYGSDADSVRYSADDTDEPDENIESNHLCSKCHEKGLVPKISPSEESEKVTKFEKEISGGYLSRDIMQYWEQFWALVDSWAAGEKLTPAKLKVLRSFFYGSGSKSVEVTDKQRKTTLSKFAAGPVMKMNDPKIQQANSDYKLRMLMVQLQVANMPQPIRDRIIADADSRIKKELKYVDLSVKSYYELMTEN